MLLQELEAKFTHAHWLRSFVCLPCSQAQRWCTNPHPFLSPCAARKGNLVVADIPSEHLRMALRAERRKQKKRSAIMILCPLYVISRDRDVVQRSPRSVHPTTPSFLDEAVRAPQTGASFGDVRIQRQTEHQGNRGHFSPLSGGCSCSNAFSPLSSSAQSGTPQTDPG